MSETVVHHPVFSHFPPWSGWTPGGMQADFIGSRFRDAYGLRAGAPRTPYYATPKWPPPDVEYFEWIAVLEAVLSARARFTMLELGAGWGRWTVRGALAAQRLRLSARLVAVEAEPTHFRWLQQHLRDNGVQARSIRAAVARRNGIARFWTGDPAAWYGQAFARPGKWRPDRPACRAAFVRTVSLRSLLRGLDMVDLIDLDIQGAELAVLAAAPDALSGRVRRVYVETHTADVENGLRELFERLGWERLLDHSLGTTAETPYGRIRFSGGGVQDWRNPRLAP